LWKKNYLIGNHNIKSNLKINLFTRKRSVLVIIGIAVYATGCLCYVQYLLLSLHFPYAVYHYIHYANTVLDRHIGIVLHNRLQIPFTWYCFSMFECMAIRPSGKWIDRTLWTSWSTYSQLVPLYCSTMRLRLKYKHVPVIDYNYDITVKKMSISTKI
jgi:hypothetical protein